MPTKKYKQKLLKHHICSIARTITCVTFLMLAVIGISSLVRAMSLEDIANEKGVPAIWDVASLGSPETITVPVDYWDQRQDSCDDENRQFEWVICGYWTKGALQGVVKDRLGTDGLPIPTYTNSTDAWNANRDVFTTNVTGHDPVQYTDNFYRWFHETSVSKHYSGEATFHKVASDSSSNIYTFGRDGTFPLDDVDFSKDDSATKQGHNYHFTSHLSIPIKISADGKEKFEFSGDDDVWVFLDNQLVLDIGGLHEKLSGSFTINTNGTLTTTVQNVNDVSGREVLGDPNNSYNGYVNPLNEYNAAHFRDVTKTIDIGLKSGDVVNLDVFYAERSTTESNVHVTLSNMNWPISADSDVQGKVIGKIEGKDNHIIQYDTYIKNRDPKSPLTLTRLSSYISDRSAYTNADGQQTYTNSGFIPLNIKTLQYTTTPAIADSWTSVNIAAPLNSADGFTLATPITMQPAGTTGDTLYFRYFAETSEYVGNIDNVVAYYTELNGASGVTYDHTTTPYVGRAEEEPANPDPITPEETYTVTVNYIIDYRGSDPDPEAEAQLPETYRETGLKTGDPYNVPTKSIAGYTPDESVITGHIEDSNVSATVTYVKNSPDEQPKPTHHVLIEYLHSETHEPLFPEYNNDHEEGDSFIITPKDKSGFTKDHDRIIITVVDNDIHIIVLYTPNTPVTPGTNPIIPSGPTDPNPEDPNTPVSDQPENPLPILPIIPGGDDELLYFAPLGEVAYVPNTGVISDVVAPIFEQYFANAILSQGFVLATLLIFAGAFATYFSLRRYMDLSTATATRVAPVKKMPKNLTKSSATKKSTRTRKSTSKKSAK